LFLCLFVSLSLSHSFFLSIALLLFFFLSLSVYLLHFLVKICSFIRLSFPPYPHCLTAWPVHMCVWFRSIPERVRTLILGKGPPNTFHEQSNVFSCKHTCANKTIRKSKPQMSCSRHEIN
jgi:hypothetical protein